MNRSAAVAVTVLGYLGLLAAALVWSVPRVETDLVARGEQELATAGIDGVSVEFDGRNGHVDGVNADSAAEELASLRGARWVRSVRTPPPLRSAPTPTTTPPPPATASLAMTRDGPTVRLDGIVETEAGRQALTAEVVAAGFDVDDALVTDPEIDGSDVGGIVFLIGPTLDGSDDGELVLIDGTVTVTGVAFDPVEAEEIAAAVDRAEQSGLLVDNEVTILELSEEQQIVALQVEIDQIFELARAIEGQNPSFGISDGKLSPPAAAILDRVVVAMRRYPLPAADVIGHTDSRGSNEFNQTLSETRAANVVTYLTAAGIEAERLTSSGRGETEPIADNGDADGRTENRRVDFVVRKRDG
ncbi:MAG: OmpA family protein [Acidimicrobiales bacterium]